MEGILYERTKEAAMKKLVKVIQMEGFIIRKLSTATGELQAERVNSVSLSNEKGVEVEYTEAICHLNEVSDIVSIIFKFFIHRYNVQGKIYSKRASKKYHKGFFSKLEKEVS